jgi:Cu(I)/Ag(I) efflux system membrane fusion protein
MELVRAGHRVTAQGDTTTGTVTVSEREVVLAGVSTVRVAREPVETDVRAVGTLVVPEPQKSLVSARFGGRIEKVHVRAPGAVVKAGDPLFDIYSPDLVQAEHEYLQTSGSAPPLSGGSSSSSRSKLRLMGLTEAQIHTLDSTGEVPLVSTYYSPAGGTVMDKKIVVGSYVTEGMTLFELAGLSTLWNIAEVPVGESETIQDGDKATIAFPSEAHEEVAVTVAFVYPVVDPQSRTVKVRLAVNNAAGRLKPNMYTETRFASKRRDALIIPVGAVLRTGKRDLVYVRRGEGNRFEPREVRLGTRSGRMYEVVSGLTEGEVVVREGGFLIDSERELMGEKQKYP